MFRFVIADKETNLHAAVFVGCEDEAHNMVEFGFTPQSPCLTSGYTYVSPANAKKAHAMRLSNEQELIDKFVTEYALWQYGMVV